MTEVLLETSNIRKSFGALVATDGVDFQVREGETHAVIGPNGAGKTPSSSRSRAAHPTRHIRFAGERYPPVRSEALAQGSCLLQITSIYREFSTLDNVAGGKAHAGHSFRFWKRREDGPLVEPALQFWQPSAWRKGRHSSRGLSHGEQRQLRDRHGARRSRACCCWTGGGRHGHRESAHGRVPRHAQGSDHRGRARHGRGVLARRRISVLVYGRIIATGTPAESHQRRGAPPTSGGPLMSK